MKITELTNRIKNIKNNKSTDKDVRSLPCGGWVETTLYTARWYDKAGREHRDGMPAIQTPIRTVYMRHGKIHRIDGPAISVRGEGEPIKRSWFVNGYHITSWEDFSHESGIPMEDIMMKVLEGVWTLNP